MTKVLKVPYDHWLRADAKREAHRKEVARNRYRWPSEINRANSDRHERRFVIWDGEGPHDTGYSLFGNSDGDEICHPQLGTEELLDLILDHRQENRHCINLWFGMEYDVSMICNDLPKRQARALAAGNRCVYGDYELFHIPHKWLTIKRGQVNVTIYDYQSFFQVGLVDALLKWGIGTAEEIALLAADKDRRNEFLWRDIESIRTYFHLEMRLMLQLADELRTILERDKFVPRSWHGPGALATIALRRNKVFDAMAPTPAFILDAVRAAFAGGHFELFLAGHFNCPVWNYDINSAYPYYMTFLPNLAKGKWRRGRAYEPGKFAVYRIEYRNDDANVLKRYPLFYRSPTGEVSWPPMVRGWYWSPEAELVTEDAHAKFVDAWIFDEDDPTDRPFAFINEYYHRRQVYKRAGDAVERAYKLIINAIYGQLARRVGWNKTNGEPPASHQLEWAGFITSACRAAVYKAGLLAGDDLVSIDTDGIYSLRPIDGLVLGDGLGEWELTEYLDGAFQQSGVYALMTNHGWEKAKTRGIPRGKYDPVELVRCASKRETMYHYKDVFIGYRQALMGRWEDRNQWVKQDMKYAFGGDGKRFHWDRACKRTCRANAHRLSLHVISIYAGSGLTVLDSQPHYLPWLDNGDEMRHNKASWAMFDEADPEMEGIDEWMMQTLTPSPPQWPSKSPRLRLKFGSATVAARNTNQRPKLGFLRFARTGKGTGSAENA